MYDEFVEEWKDRYLRGFCTLNHLQRLLKIERINNEEYEYILKEKDKIGVVTRDGR